METACCPFGTRIVASYGHHKDIAAFSVFLDQQYHGLMHNAEGQPLASRRIVITGAGRGLGRHLALTFSDAGADIVLLGRDPAALRFVSDTIEGRTQRRSEVVCCDLAHPNSVKAACESILGVNPVVDVLVNNGAPWLPGRLPDLSQADIVATVAAAVTGTVLITRGLLPGLLRSPAADIVTIVSTAGLPGRDFDTGSAVFHAAKHGQAGFCSRLRAELKPRGIRVTAIFPGDFEDGNPVSSQAESANDSTPAGKLTSREVVSAVVFALTAPRNCTVPVIVLEDSR